MSFIASRLNLFDSGSFQKAISSRASLKDAIDLSIGIPEELTPEHIKSAGLKAIEADKTVYTPGNGILELRIALAEKLQTENGIPCTEETVTVVPGLTTGQLLVYMAILDPGDEVIVLEPYYPPYAHLASMLGANPVCISTLPSFQPDVAQIEASISGKTKAIVVNSPNNPSGAMYSEELLRQIADVARKHNVLVISDEIYEHFAYTKKHFSIGSIYPNTITMNGFSKEFAMTGWRIGYIAGPAEIINAINALQQYVVMSASSIGQHAALAGLKKRPNVIESYRKKRDLLAQELKECGYENPVLDGAFYAFIPAPKDIPDIEFVEKAIERGLILLPGSAFSQVHGYIRISYGAEMSHLKKGMEIFKRLANEV
jgi:aspartate/methionine/tyrosine aminotransferase